MLAKLAHEQVCAKIIHRASDVLGRDIGAETTYATNRDVQVGMFVANHAHLARLEDAGVQTEWSLGLSLGEYNHLVHIGALAFEDALRLVDTRGGLYDAAKGGLMVSVFPLAAKPIEDAIARLGLAGQVAIGLYNSPRQQVISGERAAVEQVLAALEDEDYFATHVIEPRIPMHAPCFGATAARFAEVLAGVKFTAPTMPYVPNVQGAIIDHPTPDEIRACLVAHVHLPVRWQASIEAVAERVLAPCFVECGPRAVLHNLFGKDWMPGRRAKTDSSDAWAAHVETVAAELRSAG
jgi:[acyl-carrier-protein] S-malonyltransferase